jgi:3-oxoacyl-[acyl-carrier-protein] synthase-3
MKVRAISTATPDWTLDNETIHQWSGLDPQFVKSKLGVVRRGFLAHDETTTDLAGAACNRLFEENPDLDRKAVGLLVLVTQNPDYRLPHNAALLQATLGLERSTASFDINLGCSGYVYGLSVAKSLMMSENIDNALLVTCDPYSKIMRRDSREVIGIFGDGASATWLSCEAGAAIGKADFGTDGRGARHLIVRAGGAAQPLFHLDGAEKGETNPADDALYMNGRAIFNFMQTCVPMSVVRCLARNDLKLDDVDTFVFHQASRFMLESLADRMGLSREKVPIMLERTGNTVSSSIPMVLSELFRQNELRGTTILVSGFGVGLSWATNVLVFDEAT